MPFKRAKIELLRQVALFSACTNRELSRIASLADEIQVPAGTVLCREGEPGREFFVIAEGRARVSLRGRRLAVLGPGDFFGEMSLLDAGPRAATVQAETPLRLYVIDARGFSTLLDQTPSVARKLLRGLAARLRAVEKAPTH